MKIVFMAVNSAHVRNFSDQRIASELVLCTTLHVPVMLTGNIRRSDKETLCEVIDFLGKKHLVAEFFLHENISSDHDKQGICPVCQQIVALKTTINGVYCDSHEDVTKDAAYLNRECSGSFGSPELSVE